MKNENEFNAELSKRLKRLRPVVHAYKVCDRFTEGVSDFIIWIKSTSIGVESKFVSKLPKNDGLVLAKHPFTGPQITFLDNLLLTGNKGVGLVGIEERGLMYIIPSEVIPPSGNWKLSYFDSMNFKSVPILDVDSLLQEIQK